MNKLSVIFALSFLCGCAGMPPQWWDPSGQYSTTNAAVSAPASAQPSLSAQTTPEEEEPYPAEQNIEPVMESYEELSLSPLAPAIDAANLPKESAAAQPQPAATALAAQDQAPAPAAEENLPADGSLPPPSVLQ